jgi:hypothetical protein
MGSVYADELLDYSPGDSCPLTKDVKHSTWVLDFYEKFPMYKSYFEAIEQTFENLLPARISNSLLSLLNKIDPVIHDIVDVLRLIDLADPFIEDFKKKLSSMIDGVQYYVK